MIDIITNIELKPQPVPYMDSNGGGGIKIVGWNHLADDVADGPSIRQLSETRLETAYPKNSSKEIEKPGFKGALQGL
mgnify:CR=1